MTILDIGGTIEYCPECEASFNEGTKCDCYSYLVANWGDDKASPFQSPELKGRAVKLQAESFAAAVEAYLSDTNCWEPGKDIEVMAIGVYTPGVRLSRRYEIFDDGTFVRVSSANRYCKGSILPELYA